MADIFEIAGRVHSTSQEGVVTVANEILDSNANKKQSQINSEVETRLNAYETGKFVNVETYAELPASGEVDTIYRVANWDGEQVDTTKYAEYSWDGTQYVLLGVNKNDDVIRTDVSQSLSDAEKKQARENLGMGNGDFAVASDFTNPDATKRAKVPTVGAIVDGLNDGIYDVSKRNPTGGPNSDGKFTLDYILDNANTLIPTGWRHGGMTISFVQSSDNKYVQARLMADSFTTDVTQWQGVDGEPTAGSENLVKSGGTKNYIEKGLSALPLDSLNTKKAITEINTDSQSFLKTNGEVESSASSYSVKTYNIEGKQILYVSGRVGADSSYQNSCLYCFYDENNDYIESGFKAGENAVTYNDVLLMVPSGAKSLKVSGTNAYPQSVYYLSQEILVSEYLSNGYKYAGIATPSTNPGAPRQKMFYFAKQAGTYTNFLNSITPLEIENDGLHIISGGLENNDWSFTTIFVVDNSPVPESDNIVKSSGISSILSSLPLDSLNVLKDIEESSVSLNTYLLKNGETNHILGTNLTIKEYNIEGKEIINVFGRVGGSTSYPNSCLYCFYGEGDSFISYGVEAKDNGNNYENLLVLVPSGAKTIKVSGNSTYVDASVKYLSPELLASDLLSNGFRYIGVANTTTNPGTPNQRVFYIAYRKGVYTYFDNIELDSEYAILFYDGNWHKDRFGWNTTRSILKQISTNATFTENTITFGSSLNCITIQNYKDNSTTNIQGYSGQTFNLGGTKRLVLHYDNTIEVVNSITDIVPSDIVLLGGPSEFSFGALYPLYLNSKINRLAGKGIYINKTVAVSLIGGNPFKTTIGVGSVIEFGKSEANALSLLHSKIFNVRPGSVVKLDCDIDTVLAKVVTLDKDYRVVSAFSTIHQTTDEGWDNAEVTLSSDACYVIFQGTAYDDNNNVLPSCNLRATMDLCDAKPTVFMPRSADDGYQHLTMKVAQIDMSSNSYEPSNALKAETVFYVDNGVLCLPEQYSPDGDPTRLIAFCHGHAVTYNNNSTRFDSQDIKPEYWLSEGYAIFDMDGSVTGTYSGNHDYEPAVAKVYDTAYEWIVRHYNIRTDGVLATGRSMGGGMMGVLAKCSKMPILATAPMVPLFSPFGYISWKMSGAARKEILASFGVPSSELDAVTWTSGITYYYQLTQEERNLIISNQWRFIAYTPGYVFNRPLTDTEVFNWSQGDATKTQSYMDAFFESVKNSVNVSLFKNIPMRFYTCVGDPSVWYYGVEIMHKLLSNTGMIAQIHVFPATADHEGTTDHRFEINPENLVTYTNSRGITLENVPKVYIETLAFWRVFECQDQIVVG